MCEFIYLNEAYLKDCFPLQQINELINATSKHEFLSFMTIFFLSITRYLCYWDPRLLCSQVLDLIRCMQNFVSFYRSKHIGNNRYRKQLKIQKIEFRSVYQDPDVPRLFFVNEKQDTSKKISYTPNFLLDNSSFNLGTQMMEIKRMETKVFSLKRKGKNDKSLKP